MLLIASSLGATRDPLKWVNHSAENDDHFRGNLVTTECEAIGECHFEHEMKSEGRKEYVSLFVLMAEWARKAVVCWRWNMDAEEVQRKDSRKRNRMNWTQAQKGAG